MSSRIRLRSKTRSKSDLISTKRQKFLNAENSLVTENRISLIDQLQNDENSGKLKPIKQSNYENNIEKIEENENNSENGNTILTESETRKILREAQKQQKQIEFEINNENQNTQFDEINNNFNNLNKMAPNVSDSNNNLKIFSDQILNFNNFDDSDSNSSNNENFNAFDSDYEEIENIELSAEDEASLSIYLPLSNLSSTKSSSTKQTLADIIMAKIAQKENSSKNLNNNSNNDNNNHHIKVSTIPSKVIKVYCEIGLYLSHYTSGKIPKAFKIIPTLSNWEQILLITQPLKWTCQATYQGTRLFISNLPEKAVLKYHSYILIPKVRNDIEIHKKLNYHLYQSVKCSMFKPTAFFKGFLLPILFDNFTARESIILSGLLSKCSIPVIHSSVCILKIVEQFDEYSGPICLILKTLLNKKYNLPYKVIDSVIEWFLRFESGSLLMPIIWHQTLLIIVQRYKHELSDQQRIAIKKLIKKQNHHSITPDIKRELEAGKPITSKSNKTINKSASVIINKSSQKLDEMDIGIQ